MAKAIKAAATVFVVTFLVVTGTAFIFGGTAAFAGGLSALTIFGSTVNALAIAALTSVGQLVNGLFSKGINATAENFGSKIATRTATAPRQIIYGKARVGGAITHIETAGTDNYKLSMIVVLAGHEVESLEEVMLNDTVLTTTSSGGFQYATNSRFINTDNANNFGSGRLLRYVFVDGSQTTANSTITSSTSLISTDKFIGMSYMLVQMVFDSEAFGGGIPPMSFVVKGKKVYDPRTSATAWSDNPALCVRDFITNTTYGLKATSSEVLDTTALGGFSIAANTCDTSSSVTTATVNGTVSSSAIVTVSGSNNTLIDIGHIVTGTGISGTVTVIKRVGNVLTLSSNVSVSSGVTLTFGERAYTANGITNMSADGGGVIEGLLSSCAGKLSYIDGKFVMFAGATVSPDMTITDDNLLAPISIQTKKASGETYNTVKSIYVDGNNNYVTTDSPVYTDSTYLTADTPSGESEANYIKTLEIQLPFTDTTSMAQRLQRTALLHTRKEVSVSVLCNIAFMQLQPFDWVYVTNERLGYTNKTFEVLSTNLEVLEKDGVPVLATRLSLKEIDSSVYAFASSTYTNPIDEGSSVSTGSFSVTAPTNLSLTADLQLDSTTSKVNIDATWTNNPDDLIQGTEILYGTSSGTYIGSVLVGKGKTKAVIPNLMSNANYYVVARHFSSNNVFSENTGQQTVNTGLPSAPSAPASLSATTGKALVIGLQWTAPSNSDLRAVKVYRHTSNFTPTNDTYLVSTITSEPSQIQKLTFGLEDGLTAGTTYHFAVRAINHSGTHSSFTSTTTGSFTLVDAGEIDLPDFSGYFHKEGNTTTALTSSQFNTEYGRTPLNDDILIMVNTSATPKTSKAYKWNGSTFAEITNFTTGDLVVDGTIAGAKIIAGDISADRVDTDFVSTLNLLTTSATITNNIVVGSGNNVFKAETGVGIQLGNATFGSAPFRVTEAGALTATNATITGEINATSGTFNGSIAIGTSNNIFKADTNGIYLGNATFGSAPFRVTPAGALTASSATITGALTLTNVDGTTVTYTGGNLVVGTIGSDNLGASAIFPATLRFERSNATTAPSNSEFSSAFGRNPKANDIVVVVRTDTNAQVAYKHNGSSFSAISNYIDGNLIVDGTITTDQLAANSVEANEINVGTLSAISANMGSITAGAIDIGSGDFTVSSAGVMTATGATISGAITATSLNVTNATVTGTLDASVITLNGDPLDDLFGVSGTGSGKTLAIGPDAKNQLKVDGISMKYFAYDQLQSNGDLAFDMDEDGVNFYPNTNRPTWTPTRITGGVATDNNDNAGVITPNITVGGSSLNQSYRMAVSGEAYFSSTLVLNAISSPSTTTNRIYNVGGTLYFNGSAVGGGTGDITSVSAGTNLNGGGTSGAVTLNLDSTISGNHTFSNNLIVSGTLASGALTVTGAVVASDNITAYSDERLKENIETLDGKKALQMRGVSFIKDGQKGSGVIAQEVEKIAPELVITTKDEMGTKSVAYGNLVGYLIETVKDQQKQIDELKERLDNDSSI